jgi:2-O-methyltransferase
MTERRDLTIEFWRDVAAMLPASPVILDVGAHHLEEARLLLPYLRDAEWHAFEADPELCRVCVEYVVPALAGKYRRLEVVPAAISDHVGEVDLHLSEKRSGEPWTASSSICAPKNVLSAYEWLHFPRRIRVATSTLDAYCEGNGIVRADLLKMDVQGAEVQVIRGGRKILARTKYLVTEVVEGEEYEGQLGFEELVAELPGRWSLVERTLNDALLVNELVF